MFEISESIAPYCTSPDNTVCTGALQFIQGALQVDRQQNLRLSV